MTAPTYSTGDVPTASEANEWFVNMNRARKSATESVTSSTAYQSDDDLTVSVIANAWYEVHLNVQFDGAGANAFKWRLACPAGSSGRANIITVGGSACVADITDTTGFTHDGTGAGNKLPLTVHGVLLNPTNAGTVTLQWAQGSSSGTATRVWQDSFLRLTRIS